MIFFNKKCKIKLFHKIFFSTPEHRSVKVLPKVCKIYDPRVFGSCATAWPQYPIFRQTEYIVMMTKEWSTKIMLCPPGQRLLSYQSFGEDTLFLLYFWAYIRQAKYTLYDDELRRVYQNCKFYYLKSKSCYAGVQSYWFYNEKSSNKNLILYSWAYRRRTSIRKLMNILIDIYILY